MRYNVTVSAGPRRTAGNLVGRLWPQKDEDGGYGGHLGAAVVDQEMEDEHLPRAQVATGHSVSSPGVPDPFARYTRTPTALSLVVVSRLTLTHAARTGC